MQILFFSLGVLGIILAFFGIKTLLKIRNNKAIAEFNAFQIAEEIHFEQSGLYSVSIVGGGSANNVGNFFVKITGDKIEVPMIERLIKARFFYKGNLATEYYQFEIEKPGKYTIEIKNIEDLEVKTSMLSSTRMFQERQPIYSVKILIKQTTSPVKYIVALLMAIIGFNAAGWGIILGCNPHLY